MWGWLPGPTLTSRLESGDKLIGFGRLLTDYHSIAYINYMVVDPAYQRKGVGQAILKKLLEASGDVERVFLYTDTADAFYMRQVSLRLKNGCMYTVKKGRSTVIHPDFHASFPPHENDFFSLTLERFP